MFVHGSTGLLGVFYKRGPQTLDLIVYVPPKVCDAFVTPAVVVLDLIEDIINLTRPASLVVQSFCGEIPSQEKTYQRKASQHYQPDDTLVCYVCHDITSFFPKEQRSRITP